MQSVTARAENSQALVARQDLPKRRQSELIVCEISHPARVQRRVCRLQRGELRCR
jgi:hypothetical protein